MVVVTTMAIVAVSVVRSPVPIRIISVTVVVDILDRTIAEGDSYSRNDECRGTGRRFMGNRNTQEPGHNHHWQQTHGACLPYSPFEKGQSWAIRRKSRLPM